MPIESARTWQRPPVVGCCCGCCWPVVYLVNTSNLADVRALVTDSAGSHRRQSVGLETCSYLVLMLFPRPVPCTRGVTRPATPPRGHHGAPYHGETTLVPLSNTRAPSNRHIIFRLRFWTSGYTLRVLDPGMEHPARPREHDSLNQCWFNVGPASATLAQH